MMSFYKKHLKENSFLFKNSIFGYGLLVALALALFYQKENENIIVSSVGLNIFLDLLIQYAVIVGIIFLIRSIHLVRLGNSFSINPSILGKKELELMDEKLIINSKNVKSEISFNTLKRISESKKHYFIYLDKEVAIIIPKTTLEADELITKLAEATKINVC